MSNKHGPNSWDNYEAVHRSYMKGFEHFIEEDRLTATATSSLVRWQGELYCSGGVEIHVARTQRADYRGGQLLVETTEYSYHALRRTGTTTTNLLRYDNVHVQPDHPDAHHRHHFDANGNEIEPSPACGRTGMADARRGSSGSL